MPQRRTARPLPALERLALEVVDAPVAYDGVPPHAVFAKDAEAADQALAALVVAVPRTRYHRADRFDDRTEA
jgi:hypothetical protein